MNRNILHFLRRNNLVLALLAGTLAAISLISVNSVWAQGEGHNECNYSLLVEDPACTNSSECEVSTFTAPCTKANYRLTCEVLCHEGYSGNCRITATISRLSDGLVKGVCQNWNEEECYAGQSVVTDVSLDEGVMYNLTVCLFPCYWNICQDCGKCRGRAELSH